MNIVRKSLNGNVYHQSEYSIPLTVLIQFLIYFTVDEIV